MKAEDLDDDQLFDSYGGVAKGWAPCTSCGRRLEFTGKNWRHVGTGLGTCFVPDETTPRCPAVFPDDETGGNVECGLPAWHLPPCRAGGS